jgi:hypothetical protein
MSVDTSMLQVWLREVAAAISGLEDTLDGLREVVLATASGSGRILGEDGE